MVSELKAWASEVVATVTDAIDGLHHILHCIENNQACSGILRHSQCLMLTQPPHFGSVSWSATDTYEESSKHDRLKKASI